MVNRALRLSEVLDFIIPHHLPWLTSLTSVYVYSEPVEIEKLVLQQSEVDEVRWFDLNEVWEEIQTDRHRFCVPAGGLKVLKQYLLPL